MGGDVAYLLTVTEVPGQGARTPEEYRALHARRVGLRKRTPGLQHLEVMETAESITAYVAAGTWRVRCVCGEAPSTHPTWRLACCAGCGVIWTAVEFPADREAIEAVLLKRPSVTTRNWQAPETVDDLIVENVAHGLVT